MRRFSIFLAVVGLAMGLGYDRTVYFRRSRLQVRIVLQP
jgi:hypothetical protein